MTGEIVTDERGQPRKVTPEMFAQKALRQGRIHEGELDHWVAELRHFPDDAADELLARRPTRALAERSQLVSEDAYLSYARATGVIGMRDDPRVRPSWRR